MILIFVIFLFFLVFLGHLIRIYVEPSKDISNLIVVIRSYIGIFILEAYFKNSLFFPHIAVPQQQATVVPKRNLATRRIMGLWPLASQARAMISGLDCLARPRANRLGI